MVLAAPPKPGAGGIYVPLVKLFPSYVSYKEDGGEGCALSGSANLYTGAISASALHGDAVRWPTAARAASCAYLFRSWPLSIPFSNKGRRIYIKVTQDLAALSGNASNGTAGSLQIRLYNAAAPSTPIFLTDYSTEAKKSLEILNLNPRANAVNKTTSTSGQLSPGKYYVEAGYKAKSDNLSDPATYTISGKIIGIELSTSPQ